MKRTCIPLIVVAVLLALPFWAIVLLSLPVCALEELGVQAPVMDGLLAAPHFGATLLLAELPRYVIIWEGALDGLYRAPCSNGACVRPLLTKYHQPADRLYFVGRYEEVLPSPDGKCFAFVARYVYGPEDLLIVGSRG